MAGASLLLDHFEEEANGPRHDALVLARLNDGDGLALVVLAVLVALHAERLARARLPVGEDR